MKRFALLLLLCSIACAPHSSAQDHFAVGAYADYFRLSQTDTNSAGLGGRLGFGIAPHVMLEAEVNYDFGVTFTETFANSGSLVFQRTDMRLLHGLFGPKVSLGHSNFHFFVTAKGGFLDTMLDSRPATLGTFVSSVNNLRSQNISAVFYPGGGVEGRIGPIGLRLDAGDEMYFNSGTHHNLRLAFGPYVRF
jgi:hypothetical protein